MKGALDVHGALLAADVPHEVVRLPRTVLSADDLPAALELEASACAAVRCYVADGMLVAVLVRSGCVPDPLALLDAVRARSVRAATVEEVNAATDFSAGLVSPVGLPDDVVLLADEALAGTGVVYVAAGEGRVALGIRRDLLLDAAGARVVRLAARPRSPAEGPGSDGALPPAAPVVDLRAPRPHGLPRRPAG